MLGHRFQFVSTRPREITYIPDKVVYEYEEAYLTHRVIVKWNSKRRQFGVWLSTRYCEYMEEPGPWKTDLVGYHERFEVADGQIANALMVGIAPTR